MGEHGGALEWQGDWRISDLGQLVERRKSRSGPDGPPQMRKDLPDALGTPCPVLAQPLGKHAVGGDNSAGDWVLERTVTSDRSDLRATLAQQLQRPANLQPATHVQPFVSLWKTEQGQTVTGRRVNAAAPESR